MPTAAKRVFLIAGKPNGRKGTPAPMPQSAAVEHRPGGTLSRMPPPDYYKNLDERVSRHPPPQRIVVRSETAAGPQERPRVKSQVPASSRADGFRTTRVVPQLEGGGYRFRNRSEPPLMLGGRTGGARGEVGWSVTSARTEQSPQVLARLHVKNNMP